MAIQPSGFHPLDWHPGATTPAARASADTGTAFDWNQVMMDQEKVQARASLRPDTAAAIRAAQNVWLASQEKPVTATRSPDNDGDIEAFITMLIDQASGAKRGL